MIDEDYPTPLPADELSLVKKKKRKSAVEQSNEKTKADKKNGESEEDNNTGPDDFRLVAENTPLLRFVFIFLSARYPPKMRFRWNAVAAGLCLSVCGLYVRYTAYLCISYCLCCIQMLLLIFGCVLTITHCVNAVTL